MINFVYIYILDPKNILVDIKTNVLRQIVLILCAKTVTNLCLMAAILDLNVKK